MSREKIYLIHELMKSINKSINKKFGCRLGYKKLNPSVLTIMLHLLESEPKTLKELSQEAGLANSTVSELVDKLVEKGMVKRVQDEDDRRRVLISATDNALKVKDEIHSRHREYFEQILSDVDEKDIDIVLKGLSKLNEIVNGSEKL